MGSAEKPGSGILLDRFSGPLCELARQILTTQCASTYKQRVDMLQTFAQTAIYYTLVLKYYYSVFIDYFKMYKKCTFP